MKTSPGRADTRGCWCRRSSCITREKSSRDAVSTILNLVRPMTVMPSHVAEQATTGGAVRSNTWTERFIRNVRDYTNVVLPVSDVTLSFDGEGRCIGCPR